MTSERAVSVGEWGFTWVCVGVGRVCHGRKEGSSLGSRFEGKGLSLDQVWQ